MDIKTIFRNGILEEEVFMTQPKGFDKLNNTRKVCELERSFSGSERASWSCNLRFNELIRGLIVQRNVENSCGYKKVSGSTVTTLVLYVGHILLIGYNVPLLESVKTKDWTMFRNGRLK